MLIVSILLVLVVIIISKFSVAGADKLIFEFEQISNYSGAVLTIFSLGFITACIEDISKFIDKKLKNYEGDKK